MSWLLDTNVVSETRRPSPDAAVVAWIDRHREEKLFLSVVSVAEIRRGVELTPIGFRRQRLEEWAQHWIYERFANRIIPIDTAVAEAWGRLTARAERAGKRKPDLDAFIAATADVHGLTVVTRNTADFAPFGCKVVDPWQAG